MNAIISKGKFQIGYGVLILILSIGLFFFSRYLFQNAFAFQYLQIDRLIAAVVFTALFTYFILRGLADYKAVDVYEEYLKVKWFFGLIHLKLRPSDITQFGESSVKEAKYIYLRKGNRDILLNVDSTENDIELIEQLRAWRVKRKDNILISEVSKFEARVGNIILKIIGAILCFVVFYSSYFNVRPPIEQNSLIQVYGHLDSQPDIDYSTVKSPSTGVSFRLKEYPSFHFSVGEPGYNSMNITELKSYEAGTQATFWIEKMEYQKKIANKSNPGFSDKHFNWDRIDIYEANLNGRKVLELDKFNDEAGAIKTSNRKWGLLIVAVLAFVFFGGLKAIR
jgi:hypothetical protein